MNILLADDHALFRDALVRFIESLRPEWLVNCFSDFHSAYNHLKDNNDVDLILLDLRMPGMNGLEGLKTIRKKHPNKKIAILSGVAEEHQVKEAMQIGAHAYLPKTLSGKALIRAIDLVVQFDQKFIPMHNNNSKIMPSYYDDHTTFSKKQESRIAFENLKNELLKALTKREKEVLSYISQGLTNKDIAQEMGIEISTVKLHVGHVCKKMSAENRTQIAIMAHQYSLVP